MISIAIVEDEELYAKQLQQFLHQYEKENKVPTNIYFITGRRSL